MRNNSFSVVMPIYNSEKTLADAILSLLSQSYKNFELIIIDDFSKDKSFKIATEFEKKYSKIKVFRMKKNSGAPACMNLGVKIAKYNWISIVDSDAIEPKDWLQKANKLANKNFGVFGGRVDYQMPAENENYVKKAAYYLESSLFPKKSKIYTSGNLSEPPIAGANLFFTKDIFKRVKGFKEEIRTGYDRLFICKALERDFSVAYSPKLLVYHPLYDFHSVNSVIKRSATFMRWRNVIFKENKLMRRPYQEASYVTAAIIILFIIFAIFYNLLRTVLVLFFLSALTLAYKFIYLTITKKISFDISFWIIFLDILKKSISLLLYITKLKPKSMDWKERQHETKHK